MNKTTNSSDWLNGYHQALEDAAKECENKVNIRISSDYAQDEQNRAYEICADAIRAMKDKGL